MSTLIGFGSAFPAVSRASVLADIDPVPGDLRGTANLEAIPVELQRELARSSRPGGTRFGRDAVDEFLLSEDGTASALADRFAAAGGEGPAASAATGARADVVLGSPEADVPGETPEGNEAAANTQLDPRAIATDVVTLQYAIAAAMAQTPAAIPPEIFHNANRFYRPNLDQIV